MKFGALVNPQTASSESPHDLREGMLRIARTADTVGFDQIVTAQHYLADFTQFQQLPFLARLTGEISNVELGTSITLLPFYHPVEIAEQIATIDALHDNRTVFGVGAGYRDVEFAAFGIPKSERVPRLVEGLELTQLLLSEESVTYDGAYYSVTDASIPVRPDEPLRVWIAANANRAVERAARIGDAWLVNPHSTIAEIKHQLNEFYFPIREEHNADTKVPVLRETFVAPTHEEAVETAREYLWEKYQKYISWGQDEAMEDTTDLHRPFDELAEDRFLLGTPEEVCEQVEKYEAELDAEYLIVRSNWPGMPYEETQACLKLIGDEVIPNV